MQDKNKYKWYVQIKEFFLIEKQSNKSTKQKQQKKYQTIKKKPNIKQNKKQEIKNKHRDFLHGKNDKKLTDVIE